MSDMYKLFGPESTLVKGLTKVGELIFLNMLWLLGCLPVVTIGTSTAALYRCVRLCRTNTGVSLFQEFISAYKANFKKATALFAILVILSGVVLADVYIALQLYSILGIAGVLGFVALAALILMVCGYLLPLQARFENTVGQTLKNAWVMALVHLPKSLAVMALNLLPALMLALWPEVFLRCLPLLTFCGGAAIAYVNDWILDGVFLKYI